jgi:hypothetical protein
MKYVKPVCRTQPWNVNLSVEYCGLDETEDFRKKIFNLVQILNPAVILPVRTLSRPWGGHPKKEDKRLYITLPTNRQ